MFVLIGVDKTTSEHGCRLVGTYETMNEAHAVMVREVRHALDEEYGGSGADVVTQDHASIYNCDAWDEWFIFESDKPTAFYF